MINGEFHPDFKEVAEVLDRQLTEETNAGASFAVYHRGEKVVDIWGGQRNSAGDEWNSDTMAMSFSTTKGVASTALHMCADRGQIDYDDKVADHWPGFAQNGKEEITVRQILCHESGLHLLGEVVDDASVMLDWEAMIAAIEKMTPAYEPGTANGYHALSFGWLVGELVRRASGKPIDEFVIDEIARPLGEHGLFIGMPDSELPRVADLMLSADPIPGASTESGFNLDPEMVSNMARNMSNVGPAGFEALFMGNVASLRVPMPAVNGVFEARSLARMYGALSLGGEIGGVRLMSEDRVKIASQIQNTRPDLVLGFPLMFRLGYHAVFTTAGLLPNAFGHFGFGGSGAWADPDRELSAALTINRLAMLTIGDLRFIELGGAAVRAADTR